ncbi:MAG: hypothetical protein Q9226_005432 [Calogaya cf. arnoldii]
MSSSSQTPLQSAQRANSDTPLPTTTTSPLFPAFLQEGSEYSFLDVPNAISRQDAQGSHENFVNMTVIRDRVAALNDRGVMASKIVVLSFYEAQVRLLRSNIPHGANVSRGCREICTVDAFAGRETNIAIVDFTVALPVNSYDLDRYQTTASAASGLRPDAFIRDPARILTATTRAMDGLMLVGQFALLVSWIFPGGRMPNTIFCLAEDVFDRKLIISQDRYVDGEALPQMDALGPRNNDMVNRYKAKREAFILRKIQDGRQQLGIVRP